MISNKYVLVFSNNVVAFFCVGLESKIAPRLVQDPTKMGWYYFEKKHHHDSMKMVMMIENNVISIECDENENYKEI
jgi:hypothetical protein